MRIHPRAFHDLSRCPPLVSPTASYVLQIERGESFFIGLLILKEHGTREDNFPGEKTRWPLFRG